MGGPDSLSVRGLPRAMLVLHLFSAILLVYSTREETSYTFWFAPWRKQWRIYIDKFRTRLRPNFLHFHAVFRKFWPKIWSCRPPPWEMLDPPLERIKLADTQTKHFQFRRRSMSLLPIKTESIKIGMRKKMIWQKPAVMLNINLLRIFHVKM